MQVHHILKEVVVGGLVLETHMSEILNRYEEQNRMEREEVRLARVAMRLVVDNDWSLQNGLLLKPGSAAVSAVKSINLPQRIRDMKLSDLQNIQTKFIK